MDPFRDELAAAHAKIAQLEERIRYLEKALQAKVEEHSPPPQKFFDPNFRRSSLPVAAVIAVFAVTGFVVALAGFFFMQARAPNQAAPSAASVSFNGIATAQAPQPAQAISPTVDPRSAASSSAKPTSKPPCNCSPGDPLCSCL